MATLAIRPSLGELYRFIAKIQDYPITVRELLQRARELKAPLEVVDFYRSFDHDQVFLDEEDLTSRSEQIDIMRAEEADMPQEEERSPEEY
jgi:hypothetical protein